ncbi:MAG: hypothetical protein Q4F02_04260 [Candidatus Saccharibacteria bacterium]|nr:hypothetical protein [Candidatus Saccharibacteria bacterium]
MSNELTPSSRELSGREIRKFGIDLANLRKELSADTSCCSLGEIHKGETVVTFSPLYKAAAEDLEALEYPEESINETVSRLEATAQCWDYKGTAYSYCVISPDGNACVFSDKKLGETFVNIGGQHLSELSEIAELQRRVIERTDGKTAGNHAMAAMGRTALFVGFAGCEVAYRLAPSDPTGYAVALLISMAGGVIGSIGDYAARRERYRELSSQFNSSMEGVFADLRKDSGTLCVTDMPHYLQSALHTQLRDHEILAPQNPRDFLIRLALGVVAVRSPENDDLLYTPLSNELLGHSLSNLHELLEPLRQCQKTAEELAAANKFANQRSSMSLPTNQEGIDRLARFYKEQCDGVAAKFNEFAGNLASGVAKEITANRARLLEKALKRIAITPTYTLDTFSALHNTAFTACLQEMNKLTEDDINDIWGWIKKAYAATDEFAETTNYYRAFYEEFRGRLPQLPTPEKFAKDYPEIATGLER